MAYIEINVKSEGQTVLEALALVQIEIERCKNTHISAIKVIHGYGSHGVGGAIKKELHFMLKNFKSKKIIKDFVPGEKWTDLNENRNKIIKVCPDLLADYELFNLNYGVTIILL